MGRHIEFTVKSGTNYGIQEADGFHKFLLCQCCDDRFTMIAVYAAVCDIIYIAESVVPGERKGLDGKDERPKPFDDCAICAFALQNILRIFPLLAPMIINTYRIPSCLFIDGESIMSREGVIQGNPLAMAFYAIATTP